MPRPCLRAALAGLLTLGWASAVLAAPGAVTAATPEAIPAAVPQAPARSTPTAAPTTTGTETDTETDTDPEATEPSSDPLVVHLDAIDPAIPRSGSIEISGTVTNASDETYTRINLHAFSSQTPVLDSASLSIAAMTDPSVDVGPRVTVPGTFATVDTLAPGETAFFSDSVPVELLGLSGQAGVYWIGIHALGDGAEPRDAVADGRARTFIPLRAPGSGTLEASVILPIRQPVWYAKDGTIAGPDRWAESLAEGGTLDGVLDVAESAGDTPYTWMADPAVLLAVYQLSLGNPPRSLAPDPSVPGQEPTNTPTPEAEGGGETAPSGSAALMPTPESTTGNPENDQLAEAATAWLDRFRRLVAGTPVLTLPYGDLDVSSAIRYDQERFDQAITRSAEIMTGLGLPFQPVIAPESKLLSPDAIQAVPAGSEILLGDNAFGIRPSAPNSIVRLLGHRVVVTSTGAESGGPGPTEATDPLAMRQRVLSEAALRLANGDTAPLVLTLPSDWSGVDGTRFFAALEQPWLQIEPYATTASPARAAVGVPASTLVYTEADTEAELDPAAYGAVDRAVQASSLLESVLSSVTTVEAQVRDEVLVTLSEQHRGRPRLALMAARRIQEALRADLASVRIEAPKAVTLSSDSGRLGATLVNGLDQPVEVSVRVESDGELSLSGGGVRALGPNARSVVRFDATAERGGVHNVRFVVTDLEGTPLGSSDELPIRAAGVSALIWIVMAGGALVLFGMIGYRLPGKIRARREAQASAESPSEAVPEVDSEPDTGA